MSTVIVVIVVSIAIVAPWATISTFESSRLAGWILTFVSVAAHVATWAAMASNKEAAFFCAAPWAAYEFILSFIPMGIGEEIEQREAAETVVNKG